MIGLGVTLPAILLIQMCEVSWSASSSVWKTFIVFSKGKILSSEPTSRKLDKKLKQCCHCDKLVALSS